jgi:hypothetical protein
LTVAAQKDPESSRKGSTKRRAKAPAAGLEREFERQGPLEIGEAVVDIGCPDCRGVLAVREHGKHHWLGFRCRIGHAFAADSLIMAKTAQIEQSLESALAALEEIAQVCSGPGLPPGVTSSSVRKRGKLAGGSRRFKACCIARPCGEGGNMRKGYPRDVVLLVLRREASTP